MVNILQRRDSKLSTDSKTLALLGKKQVLKRRFGFWSLFAFAVCELITWETVLALFSQGLENGGPAGLVYGFLIAWLSTLSVYTVISELGSMAPIASGQYYWVYMLAPQGYKKATSYIVGWLTTLAWVATVATETLFAGTIIQGILILNYPSYDPQMWQGTLLTWAVILVNIFINVVVPAALPKLEILVMVLHICGFIAIIATLLATSEIGSTESVWLTSLNEGGWPTQGLSYCVGFLGNVATFVGADASIHLAEETENAAINIPRAICAGMIINGLIGFGMMVATLYVLGDPDSVLDPATQNTGFPFIQIFINSVQSVPGAVAMASIVLFLTWMCSLGITTTASRMTWSFARDKGLPFSKYLSKVSKTTRIPIIAIFACTILAALLTLIYIGSYTAFNDVISLTITGFYGSYLIPCALLLYHRIKGNVLPYNSKHASLAPDVLAETSAYENAAEGGITEKPRVEEDTAATTLALAEAETRFIWGPWHLPGWLGTLNNIYACVYMVFVIFWSVWPPVTPVDASTMNYSVVVTGGVMILAGVWYWIGGRKQYKGPIVEDIGPSVDEDIAAHELPVGEDVRAHELL